MQLRHSQRLRIERQIARRRGLARHTPADYAILAAALASVAIVIFAGQQFYQTRVALAQAQTDLAKADGVCLSALAGFAFDQYQRESAPKLRGSIYE